MKGERRCLSYKPHEQVDEELHHYLRLDSLVEAINTQIRLIARRAFGFHSPSSTDRARHARPRRTLSRPSWAHTVTHGNVRRAPFLGTDRR